MARKKKPSEKDAERDAAARELKEGLAIDKRLPPHKLLPVIEEPNLGILKTNSYAYEIGKLNEIANLLWLPESLDEQVRNARIVKAMDLFTSIKPSDGIEAMLAAQMVGTHSAAMECLRRAMVEGQTFEGRNASLGHAQKMMGLYARQLAALDKHRGKGQQKVTVEYVNVEAGGQAIVGNVEAGAKDGSGKARGKVAPPQIEHSASDPDPLDELSEYAAASKPGKDRAT